MRLNQSLNTVQCTHTLLFLLYLIVPSWITGTKGKRGRKNILKLNWCTGRSLDPSGIRIYYTSNPKWLNKNGRERDEIYIWRDPMVNAMWKKWCVRKYYFGIGTDLASMNRKGSRGKIDTRWILLLLLQSPPLSKISVSRAPPNLGYTCCTCLMLAEVRVLGREGGDVTRGFLP